MSVSSLTELLKQTADEIKKLADPSLAIGQPIRWNDITVIPVSKASFGVAGGGADAKNGFGGGAGGKAELTPLSFLVLENGQVRMVSVAAGETGGGVMEAAKEAVSGLLKKGKEKKAKKVEECPKS